MTKPLRLLLVPLKSADAHAFTLPVWLLTGALALACAVVVWVDPPSERSAEPTPVGCCEAPAPLLAA